MTSRYSEDVLRYLQDHEHSDPLAIILQKSPFEEVSSAELAAQLLGRKVAKRKFPFLLDHKYYQYPVKVSLEQSSSELTAKYKADLIEGKTIADLTGGMGIDTIYFAQQGKQVSYIEVNETLCKLNSYNFQELGLDVEVHCSTAEEFLDSGNEIFDCLYIDPSRRIEGSKKTGIKNLVPNVVQLQEQLLSKGANLLIKLSPMQDITDVLQEVDFVKEIHVLSVRGDVKELLLLLEKGFQDVPTIVAVELDHPKKRIAASLSETKLSVESGEIKKYIYQPHPVVVKASLHNYQAKQSSLSKLHPNTQLYSSAELLSDWLGRTFEIIVEVPLQKKAARKIFSERKVNIISKNHPLTPAQIAKKLGLVEGGTQYLIAVTNHEGAKKAYLCERLM